MNLQCATLSLVLLFNVCRVRHTKGQSDREEELVSNYTFTTTVGNDPELVDKIIVIKSRFSFNITHKEVWDEHNTVYFYWMKTISKGIYFETKDISDNYQSKSNFYKLQRNDLFKWKLRNITDVISPDKIERIRGLRKATFNDTVEILRLPTGAWPLEMGSRRGRDQKERKWNGGRVKGTKWSWDAKFKEHSSLRCCGSGGRTETSTNGPPRSNEQTDDTSSPSFKIKILPRNNFRLVKTHPKNRNKIRIFEAEFPFRFPVIDFLYVDHVEDTIFFCALHDDVDSSLFVAFGKKPESKTFEFSRSLENVLCINPRKNFPDTWLSSSVSESLVDVHRSVSSRGVLLGTQFRKKMDLEEARMLHVDHLQTAISFDFGKSWSVLRLKNQCLMEDSEPILYLDLSFSRLFFDKPFLGILETSKVPGLMISTGHLMYPDDSETYPGVFVSEDGGLSWNKIFDERFLIAMSSDGELLTGIRQCLSGPTKHLFASYNFGRTWKSYQIFDREVCIHEVLASPFDTFAILSSKPEYEMWIVSVMDFEKSASSTRKCLRKDINLQPLGLNEQFCVSGHRILKYRRNSGVQCKIPNYDSRFLNFSCICTEKDFVCINKSCKNVTREELRTNLSDAKTDLKMRRVVSNLGFKKELGNTCILSRKGFRKYTSPLPTCRIETKKLLNVREVSSKAAPLRESRLGCLIYTFFLYAIFRRKL